ncbi:Glyoxylate carboligase OS=Streptomyces alboniger OX=132473 GN=gcl PE=3 SV=1 [Streptomyces alboniger]
MSKADPETPVVALSGDYDFQFMIEELAVGAQHRIPYVHVLVNNAYLGLIRQAQIGLDINFQVNLEFENQNSPELGVYGVDHVKVAAGLGCKAIRVTEPGELGAAFEQAKKLAAEHRVPVVVEAILERITNISMSPTADISAVKEFEELATKPAHTPTAIRPLKV